jgi:hypothetical protein
MREYQAVIIRLKQPSREDEEAITDLLNERARVGWTLCRLTGIEGGRVLVVFSREA